MPSRASRAKDPRPARANHGPRDKLTICEHGPPTDEIQHFFRSKKFSETNNLPPPRRQKIFGQCTISGLKNFPAHVHCKCCTVPLPQFFIPKLENLPKFAPLSAPGPGYFAPPAPPLAGLAKTRGNF